MLTFSRQVWLFHANFGFFMPILAFSLQFWLFHANFGFSLSILAFFMPILAFSLQFWLFHANFGFFLSILDLFCAFLAIFCILAFHINFGFLSRLSTSLLPFFTSIQVLFSHLNDSPHSHDFFRQICSSVDWHLSFVKMSMIFNCVVKFNIACQTVRFPLSNKHRRNSNRFGFGMFQIYQQTAFEANDIINRSRSTISDRKFSLPVLHQNIVVVATSSFRVFYRKQV